MCCCEEWSIALEIFSETSVLLLTSFRSYSRLVAGLPGLKDLRLLVGSVRCCIAAVHIGLVV